MEIWKKFLSFSRIRQIAIAVCLAHLLAILAMTVNHFATRRLRPAKPIAVRTIPASRPVPLARIEAKPASSPAKKETPKPQAKPETKKTEPVKPVAKKTEPAKTIAKTEPAKAAPAKSPTKVPPKLPKLEEPAPVQNEALNEIAKSLRSLAEESEFKSASFDPPPIVLPKTLTATAQPKLIREENPLCYEDYLVAYLQGALDLPERGNVKMKIQVDRFGHLIECEILDARNSKNAEFLKKRLPELAYPCFNDFGITDLSQTFTITFCNVENR